MTQTLLSEETILQNPFSQFNAWFSEAGKTVPLAESMCLSTISKDHYPESRMVLLKDFSEKGFVFYTNFNSAKSKSLSLNPKAALLFFWMQNRQMVRIQGDVSQVTDEEADEYFQSRPRESQIGAWASLQSEPLSNRPTLDQRVNEFTQKFENEQVPRPPHWSGYVVAPNLFEFWQEGPSRLHDRFLYRPSADGAWNFQRLYP